KAPADNTLLYVALGVGGFLILLTIIGGAVAIVLFTGCMQNSTAASQTNYRSSIESGYN
ncbi:unnamed protein product, partial [Rotaria magnacalcarata]